jgi:hypothetical protein
MLFQCGKEKLNTEFSMKFIRYTDKHDCVPNFTALMLFMKAEFLFAQNENMRIPLQNPKFILSRKLSRDAILRMKTPEDWSHYLTQRKMDFLAKMTCSFTSQKMPELANGMKPKGFSSTE